MQQAEEYEASFTMGNRLLPGDRAPPLRLARVFNRDQPVEQITFDRLTVVILWNAGCVGCLPIVDEIAALGTVHDVPCYGVAVMVRDVERTAAEAGHGNRQAILALEERPIGPLGMGRGSVTRDWLEASGMQGVPCAFLIDGAGVVAWIGYPDGISADGDKISDVLAAIIAGRWDVGAARAYWRATVSDQAVAELRLVREIFDSLISGEIDTARDLIESGERLLPSLVKDVEFNILKFDALVAAPTLTDAALAHYAEATVRFPDNLRLQSMLGGAIVQQMGQNDAALRLAAERLAKIEDEPVENENDAALRVRCRLLEAEAEISLGRAAAAMAAIERANARSKAADFPETISSWAAGEIERLRGKASSGRTARDVA